MRPSMSFLFPSITPRPASLALGLSLLGSLSLGAIALAQDAPPIDTKALLSSLKEIEQKQKVAEKQNQARILQDITAAGASNQSAIAFYMNAMRDTSFKGQPHEQTLFTDWKKKEADHLKSNEMAIAIRLHLNYLALTLQRSAGATTSELMPTLINYTAQVTAARNQIGSQEMMRKSVTDSIFARWYGLNRTLSNLKEWETNPGNVDSIYQRTIIPQMRKDKDARLLAYWDAKIQREASDAQSSQRAFNAEEFDLIRKPELLWNRAKDEGLLGQRNRAISDMYSIVKNYPDHPNKAQWISQLTECINNPGYFSDGSGGSEDSSSSEE